MTSPETPITPETALLTDRVALVTGAAQGIGEATALTLARFGADLVVCDKLPEPQKETVAGIEALGRRVISEDMDVRDDEAVDRLLGRARDEFGRVDILVNNAGGGFHASFLDVNTKGQTALVNENFTQVTSFVRGCVPLMTNGGSIVNITSIEGHRAGPGFGVYSAMKAAVENLSKTLALELSDRRIRVNCVAPDVIPTPGDAGLVAASQAMQQAELHQPWPDGGTTWDCAAAVLYLASDLSRFVTGSTIHVDGGTHAASGWRRGDDGNSWRL
ncbi:MAG TPA: SDR family oxidoreductase [Microthrixaceae bacterium]|nr:SDR family oxidoreductase [Microthrixaceae bacterium]